MNILANTILNFAQAYGTGVYGCGQYATATSCSNTGATASGASGGLVNTGFAVIAVITAACLIIFAALVVRFSRRKTSPTA